MSEHDFYADYKHSSTWRVAELEILQYPYVKYAACTWRIRTELANIRSRLDAIKWWQLVTIALMHVKPSKLWTEIRALSTIQNNGGFDCDSSITLKHIDRASHFMLVPHRAFLAIDRKRKTLLLYAYLNKDARLFWTVTSSSYCCWVHVRALLSSTPSQRLNNALDWEYNSKIKTHSRNSNALVSQSKNAVLDPKSTAPAISLCSDVLAIVKWRQGASKARR